MPPVEVGVVELSRVCCARSLTELLSSAGQSGAASFRFDTDRQRFTARRIVLRILLADYLNEEPLRIEIVADANGKLAVGGRRTRLVKILA